MSKELAKKIASIMMKVQYIQKRGRNQFHKYNYATEADVNDAVREHMAELNMIMIPSVKETSIRETTTRSGNTEYIARVDMDFTFIDGDSGESLTLSMSGEGQDTGDKAIYKAISGTQKYAIMKLFMIPTGDDPERDDTQPEQAQPTGNQTPPSQPTALVSESQVKMIYAKANEMANLIGSSKENVLNTLAHQNYIGPFQSVESLEKNRGSKAIELLDGWIKTRKEKQQQ